MQTTHRHPIVLGPGAGEHRHFLNHLATTKLVASDTDTRMSAVEFFAPRGFGPPLHRHSEEDELMYVTDGEIRFDAGSTSPVARSGSVVFLPRTVPHTFQVLSETARFLTVTTGSDRSAAFDEFVAALGVPTERAELPEPIEIDPGHVASVCAAHGIEVLGPPPAPLD